MTLDRGCIDLNLDEVVTTLPVTGRPDETVARLGFTFSGGGMLGGIEFHQSGLTGRTRKSIREQSLEVMERED